MSAQWLLDNYRGTIRIANFLLAGGLAAALASYQFGGFSKHDWRPFAVGIGGGAVAALLALALVPLLSGGKPSEAYTAYAIAQKTPMLILYAILGSGIVLFGIGLTALLH
jgi:hypothetical protein